MSPFLAMKSSEKKVINISSDDEGLRKVRVNLGEVLEAGRIVWPNDGMLAQDEVEIMPDIETESGDDEEEAIVVRLSLGSLRPEERNGTQI